MGRLTLSCIVVVALSCAGAGDLTPGGLAGGGAATGAGGSGDPGTGGSSGAGGGLGVSQQDLYQSGTRIKALVGVTADGAKTFVGWRDTQLNLNCEFALAADGAQRCLPTEKVANTDNLFSDASCTHRVVIVPDDGCGGPSALVYQVTSQVPAMACTAAGKTVFQISGAFTPFNGVAYTKSGSSCMGYAYNYGTNVIAPVTPVDPATFQRMDVQIDQ